MQRTESQEIYGGVQMKLSNLVLAGMLVAAAMIVVSAPVAKADGVVDPRIIINAGGDPSCGGEGEPACFQGGPISTVFNGVDLSADFVYGCPDDQAVHTCPSHELGARPEQRGFWRSYCRAKATFLCRA